MSKPQVLVMLLLSCTIYDKALPYERKEMHKRKNWYKKQWGQGFDIELAEAKSFQLSEAAIQDHLHCDAFCNQKACARKYRVLSLNME